MQWIAVLHDCLTECDSTDFAKRCSSHTDFWNINTDFVHEWLLLVWLLQSKAVPKGSPNDPDKRLQFHGLATCVEHDSGIVFCVPIWCVLFPWCFLSRNGVFCSRECFVFPQVSSVLASGVFLLPPRCFWFPTIPSRCFLLPAIL